MNIRIRKSQNGIQCQWRRTSTRSFWGFLEIRLGKMRLIYNALEWRTKTRFTREVAGKRVVDGEVRVVVARSAYSAALASVQTSASKFQPIWASHNNKNSKDKNNKIKQLLFVCNGNKCSYQCRSSRCRHRCRIDQPSPAHHTAIATALGDLQTWQTRDIDG